MEFYGYPSLAEYQLYWNLDDSHWFRIFRKLRGILKEFRTFRGTVTKSSLNEVYIRKTQERVLAFREQLQGAGMDSGWLDREAVINDAPCLPLGALWKAIVKRSARLYREYDACVIHVPNHPECLLFTMPRVCESRANRRCCMSEFVALSGCSVWFCGREP
jgi:hypothetical protein